MSIVSEDVMVLVQLLAEEGFPILAGELLTEIGLGREPDEPDRDDEPAAWRDDPVDRAEGDTERIPFGPEAQFDFALKFLELRLAAPVRALAEAEIIAGQLAVPDGEASASEGVGRPITLAFRPPGKSFGDFSRDAAPGSMDWADALSNALNRLGERN